MADRIVPASTVQRVATSCLGRMACAYMNPADPGHDHEAECLLDDEAYAADLALRLVIAATVADEDAALDRLTDLLASIDPTR